MIIATENCTWNILEGRTKGCCRHSVTRKGFPKRHHKAASYLLLGALAISQTSHAGTYTRRGDPPEFSAGNTPSRRNIAIHLDTYYCWGYLGARRKIERKCIKEEEPRRKSGQAGMAKQVWINEEAAGAFARRNCAPKINDVVDLYAQFQHMSALEIIVLTICHGTLMNWEGIYPRDASFVCFSFEKKKT